MLDRPDLLALVGFSSCLLADPVAFVSDDWVGVDQFTGVGFGLYNFGLVKRPGWGPIR